MEACIDTTLSTYVDASYFFGEQGKRVQLRNTQYPDKSVINRCAMIRDFGEHTVKVLEIWSRVKGDNLNSGIVILILVVIGGLCIWRIHNLWKARSRKSVQYRRRRAISKK